MLSPTIDGQSSSVHRLLRLGVDAQLQRVPALALRLRRAGRARRQQAGHPLQRIHLERDGPAGRDRGPGHHERWQAAGVLRSVIDQCIGGRRRVAELMQRVRHRVGRHQAGLAAQQRGQQRQREQIAVAAQVHRLAVGGQALGEGGGFGHALRQRDRRAIAPGQRARHRRCAESRGSRRHGRRASTTGVAAIGAQRLQHRRAFELGVQPIAQPMFADEQADRRHRRGEIGEHRPHPPRRPRVQRQRQHHHHAEVARPQRGDAPRVERLDRRHRAVLRARPAR